MSNSKQIEACQWRIDKSLKEFHRLQDEARIYTQGFSQLAKLLSQVVERPASEWSKTNDLNAISDGDMGKLLASYPSRKQLEDILGGMVTNAYTLICEREKLQELKNQLKA